MWKAEEMQEERKAGARTCLGPGRGSQMRAGGTRSHAGNSGVNYKATNDMPSTK